MDIGSVNHVSKLKEVVDENDIELSDVCLIGDAPLSCRSLSTNRKLRFCCITDDNIHTLKKADLLELENDRYSIIGLKDAEIVQNSRFYDRVDGFKVVRPEVEFSFRLTFARGTDPTAFEHLIRKGEWDWSKFLYTYEDATYDSKFFEFLNQLRRTGVRDTLQKTVRFLYRESPPRLKKFLFSLSIGTKTLLPPEKILHLQYSDDTFHRDDIIKLYYILNKNNYPNIRVNALNSATCKINLKGQILNPITCAILLRRNQDLIPVRTSITFAEAKVNNLAESKSGQKNNTSICKDAKIDFLEEFGLIFYFIVWPVVREEYDAIATRIRSQFPIAYLYDIDFRDVDGFIDEVYAKQETKYWSIERKKYFMNQTQAPVRVIAVEVPRPRFRQGVELTVEEVKKNVRNRYCEKFGREYYHSIIHSTDNYEDNHHMRQVLDSHI